jgi:hypothetical protein
MNEEKILITKVIGQNGFTKINTEGSSEKLNYNFPESPHKNQIKFNLADVKVLNNKYINCNSTTSNLKSYYKLLEEENSNNNSYDTFEKQEKSKFIESNFVFFIEKNLVTIKRVFIFCCLMIFVFLMYMILR